MVGCKVKLTFLCIAGLVVLFHWSGAAEYDDNPENEGKSHDLRDSELSVDDVKDEDAETSNASLDARRQSLRRRRRKLVYARRRRFVVDRRRRTRRRSSRRRRWW